MSTEQDAKRWRTLIEKCQIQRFNDYEEGVDFLVLAGINWDHKTLQEAVDAMIEEEQKNEHIRLQSNENSSNRTDSGC